MVRINVYAYRNRTGIRATSNWKLKYVYGSGWCLLGKLLKFPLPTSILIERLASALHVMSSFIYLRNHMNKKSQKLRAIVGTTSLGLCVALLAPVTYAQETEPNATPFRPTVTSGANLSAPGWVELEIGGQRQGGNGTDARNSVPYLLKYSFNDKFALLLGGDGYVTTTPAQGGADVTGLGDTTTTLKYRAPDAIDGMSFGLEATVKFPTASEGLGTGQYDYSLKGIYGIDLPQGFHLDTNLMATRMGNATTDQGLYQWTWAAAVSRPLGDRWTLAFDLSGTQQRGAASTAQYLVAASYAMNKRVVLDAGFAHGLNSDSPRFTAFGGMTVLIGKLN